ncbi:MAG: hypothetical protein ACKO21_06465 [Nodosilinea sp.]
MLINVFDIPGVAVQDGQGKKTPNDYTVWTSVADLDNLGWAVRT